MKAMKKKVCFKVIGGVVSAIFLVVTSGCGAMFTGKSQSISLDSNPQGATAIVKSNMGDETKVQTPGRATLKKKRDYSIRFEKEGYTPKNMMMTKEFNVLTMICDGALFLAMMIPGVIAFSVDAGTGGWYKFSPAMVNVDLEPIGKESLDRK